jgi:hypothetical protein
MKRHPLGLMIAIVLLQTACTSQPEQLTTTNTDASYIKTQAISKTNITVDKKDRPSTTHVILEKESQDELSAAASNRVGATFAKSRMKAEKRQSNQAMSRQEPMALGQVMTYVSAPAPVMDADNMPREERDQFAHFNDNPVKQVVSDPVSLDVDMSREQLEVQGMTCYVDVCHLELSQPKQAAYWGMLASNAHLTAFLRSHIVTKLSLKQKNVSSIK